MQNDYASLLQQMRQFMENSEFNGVNILIETNVPFNTIVGDVNDVEVLSDLQGRSITLEGQRLDLSYALLLQEDISTPANASQTLTILLQEERRIYNALASLGSNFRALEQQTKYLEILTKEGKIVCLDAKVNFDSNALFRHPEIVELRDLNEEDPTEIEASKYDLAYIKLEGSIGCMVNGAGLAMATMDIIKLYGKEPANFLDVGGGASKEKVSAALKIILSDKNVKGILINIFGGIMRCDVLAQGVVDAAKEINIGVPLVVRLAGTNFKEGKEILDNSGLKLISAENLDDAAQKIVEAIK